ncbi:MAG TPA: tetratricopeptide repeat protein [Jiangellaceae bacterium]|nr:tetratricopeptide repeat protein [Jiangellaceae bacterium]
MFHIDDETLREVVDDRARAVARLTELERHDDPDSRAERVIILRSLKRLTEAEQLGRVDLVESSEDPRRQVAATIRLAHVLHWQERWEEAEDLFRQARDLADILDDDILRAFALHHLGKLLFDRGRFAGAEFRFRTALRLRELAGAPPGQLESSRDAVAAAAWRARVRRAQFRRRALSPRGA